MSEIHCNDDYISDQNMSFRVRCGFCSLYAVPSIQDLTLPAQNLQNIVHTHLIILNKFHSKVMSRPRCDSTSESINEQCTRGINSYPMLTMSCYCCMYVNIDKSIF